MIGDGRGLPLRTVLVVALVTAVLAYLFLSWWTGAFGAAPTPSPVVAAMLAVLGIAEFVVARRIRRGVEGADDSRLDPLWAHRMLLMGQAAALTGAVVGGWYLGLLGVLIPDVDAASVRTAAWYTGAMCLGSALLTAGGLRIQSVSRLDPPPPTPDAELTTDV